MIILFLDFDGVLHRYGDKIADYLQYLPRLEAVLREHTHVFVVVCSDWRKHHSMEELQSFFAPDLGPRIIGVTPRLGAKESKLDQRGIRHREAKAWLLENALTAPWIAMDDDPLNWLPGDPLVFCDDGFTDIEEDSLRLILHAIGKASSC